MSGSLEAHHIEIVNGLAMGDRIVKELDHYNLEVSPISKQFSLLIFKLNMISVRNLQTKRVVLIFFKLNMTSVRSLKSKVFLLINLIFEKFNIETI
jgi:hypothetical protein